MHCSLQFIVVGSFEAARDRCDAPRTLFRDRHIVIHADQLKRSGYVNAGVRDGEIRDRVRYRALRARRQIHSSCSCRSSPGGQL